ncbi:MAG TPA: hypothetical protein VME86_06335 [Acidobacteriaceae bacterium]|nr:hypothetical protein [Acidobacteriaceae bacterium]
MLSKLHYKLGYLAVLAWVWIIKSYANPLIAIQNRNMSCHPHLQLACDKGNFHARATFKIQISALYKAARKAQIEDPALE